MKTKIKLKINKVGQTLYMWQTQKKTENSSLIVEDGAQVEEEEKKINNFLLKLKEKKLFV